MPDTNTVQFLGNPVVWIQTLNGKPFDVLVRRKENSFASYDIEYCKRDEQLYHDMSGCGGALFLRKGLEQELTEETKNGSVYRTYGKEHLAELPEEVRAMLVGTEEARCTYCEECDDYLPRDEDELCDHYIWCDDCAGYVEADVACPQHEMAG